MPIFKINSKVLLNGKIGILESVYKRIAYVRMEDESLNLGDISELLPLDENGDVEKYIFDEGGKDIFGDDD